MVRPGSSISAEFIPFARDWTARESLTNGPGRRWWRLPGVHGLDEPSCEIAEDILDRGDRDFTEIFDYLKKEVAQAGHSNVRLERFLLSYSTGYWCRNGYLPRQLTKTFLAGEEFVRAAHRAGLTRRMRAGPYVLDIYHPRLIGTIHKRMLQTGTRWQLPRGEPWLDFLQRLGEYPEFAQPSDPPTFFAAAERFTSPDRALGGQVAAICVRNHAFRQLARAALAGDSYWWDGYDAYLTVTDQVVRDAVLTSAVPSINTFPRAGVRPYIAVNDGNSVPVSLDASYRELGLLISVLDRRRVIPNLLVSEEVSGWAVQELTDSGIPSERQTASEVLDLALGRTLWPEDRGVLVAVAGMIASEWDTEWALELYGKALETFLSVGTPMGRALALDVLHRKAAYLRRLGRGRESKQVVELGSRLMMGWDFGDWVASCAEFLEEMGRTDSGLLLEVTGSLMPKANRWQIGERYNLIESRVVALMKAGRYVEAEKISRIELASGTYTNDQVGILMIHQAECCWRLGRKQKALILCRQIMQQGEDEIFAHAALISGQIELSQKQYADALRSFQLGWRAAGATTWGSSCAGRATFLLIHFERYEECLELVEEARQNAVFPVSCRVCQNGFLAAARLGRMEKAQELLSVGIWAQVDNSFIESAYRIGLREEFRTTLSKVALLANQWIVNGDDADRPPEVRMEREEFAEYWSKQIVDRWMANVRMNTGQVAKELREKGLLEDFWAETVGELCAVQRIARQVLDYNPRLSLAIYRMICEHLDESAALRRPEVKAVYAESAFYIGSISREFGDLDASISWGEIGARVAGSVLSDSKEVAQDTVRDLTSRCLILIGNSCFDQLRYGTAVAFHARALAVQLGVESDNAVEMIRDILERLIADPPTSPALLMTLFNLGNSLRLSGNWLCGPARSVVIFGAAKLADLEDYASSYEGHHVLSGVINDIDEYFNLGRFPDDFRQALQRVREACAKNATFPQ